jgi:lipoprotein-releasing system permease protein
VGGLFALEGLAIGLTGMLIGVGIGAIAAGWAGQRGVMKLAPDVYQLAVLPSLLRVGDVLLVGGIATAVAVLASLYPAVRASRLDPATAIRYE